MNQNNSQTLVIVGGVAAGASAAARARRLNEEVRILLFEKDSYVSFANCGLPYYIGGEIEERSKLLLSGPELFQKRFNVQVKIRHEVLSINRERQTVSVRNLETGETFEQGYDRLILAPGASPILPPIEGIHARNVFTLRNLEDTDRIKDFIQSEKPDRAVVVGAGFIGLEMAEQLLHLDMKVSVVELAEQVLPPLDPEMAHVIQEELESHGVDVYLGNGLAGIHARDGLAQGVELESGETLAADLVILGIGVRPNTALAQQAGLAIGPGGGIAVNPYMQTSDPAIYAAGDVVEYEHRVLGHALRMPLAGPANRAGRIAGENAATKPRVKSSPVLGTAIVRVFGKTAGMTGLTVKAATRQGREARTSVISAGHHAGYFPGAEPLLLKLVYEAGSGKVLGAQAVGGAGVDKRMDVIATALSFGATVHDLAGLDLAYAPPYSSTKDPVHMAAFVACNDLDGAAPLLPPDASLDGKQVVDVRTSAERSQSFLPGSLHIPVDELRGRLGELDPALPTVVVCQSGLRAHVALRVLEQHGFTDIANLTGGMLVRRHARPGEVQLGAIAGRK
jgi:NADPH-dependent 2,4-dienoyl-CoA reductase/sulfur reductase-like enzyme/rhodanese-related sulfurtransferase